MMASMYWFLGYFFTADWDPLAIKSAGTKLKFSYTQLFLKLAHTDRFLAIYSLPELPTPQNYAQHLLSIDEIKPCGCKMPHHYHPLELCDPETQNLLLSNFI